MTTLDEIYTYVPGGQESFQNGRNTSKSLLPGQASAAALIFGVALDYNSASGTAPSRDFSPLDDLVARARVTAPSEAAPDTREDLAEQRENASGFRSSQLNVIFREND
jgi:hypothetical protein